MGGAIDVSAVSASSRSSGCGVEDSRLPFQELRVRQWATDRQQAVGIWTNKAWMAMKGSTLLDLKSHLHPISSYSNPIPGNEGEGREPPLVPPHLQHTLAAELPTKPRRIKPAASTSDCGSEPPLHREREHKIRGCSGDHAPVQGQQPVRLHVNDRKFLVGNSVFLSHQTSQQ